MLAAKSDAIKLPMSVTQACEEVTDGVTPAVTWTRCSHPMWHMGSGLLCHELWCQERLKQAPCRLGTVTGGPSQSRVLCQRLEGGQILASSGTSLSALSPEALWEPTWKLTAPVKRDRTHLAMLVVVEQVITRDLKLEAVSQILNKIVCRSK